MSRIALVAFKGEQMCFVHVLLNAIDMVEKGFEVRVVLEGESTRLIPELAKPTNPFHKLYMNVRQKNLIYAVCKACSTKMNVLEAVVAEGLPLAGEMAGHPALADYIKDGYQIVTF